jgi:hypothetical protein
MMSRPFAYLRDILERIVAARTKANELSSSLPWAWKLHKLRLKQSARNSTSRACGTSGRARGRYRSRFRSSVSKRHERRTGVSY